ncbi:MAG: hypothetical protein JSS66_09995 [Armatimonadetes bacterium]|nr:hypothetical protein [Armatimonadota bacterium]
MNGVKRSFSTPVRTIGVLFFIFTQLIWLPRAVFRGNEFERLPINFPKFAFPPMAIVDSVVFALFSVASVIFALNVLNYRGGFRPADVDVLFPTPVDPRTVLALRVLRDIWVSLLMPLVMGVLLWRPAKFGWASLVTGLPNPALANSALRVAAIAYFLLAIAWVWIGYATSLVFSKTDERTDRLRTAAGWILTVVVLGFGALVALRLKAGPFPDGAIVVAQSWDVRAVLFLATAATNLSMSTLTGSTIEALWGLGILLGSTALAIIVARANTAWMYEAAAMKANVTESTRQLRRSGDVMALVAQRAREGKVKAGRAGWLSGLTVRGPAALLWKEALVIKRSSVWGIVLFVALSIGVSVLAASLPLSRGRIDGFFLLGLQAMLLIGPTMGTAQSGFIESLRRIDLVKPIPLKAQHVVFLEIVAKAFGPVLTSALGLLAALVVKVQLWPFVLSGLIMFPALTLALSGVSLLLVVLLPDVEDPTQRSFRGLATMLGMFAGTLPPLVLFGLLIWLKLPPPVAALPTALVMVVVTWLTTALAGRVYEDFNPAE